MRGIVARWGNDVRIMDGAQFGINVLPWARLSVRIWVLDAGMGGVRAGKRRRVIVVDVAVRSRGIEDILGAGGLAGVAI